MSECFEKTGLTDAEYKLRTGMTYKECQAAISKWLSESETPRERLVREAMIYSEDTCWKYPFPKLCKQYGKEFIEMLQDMWAAMIIV